MEKSTNNRDVKRSNRIDTLRAILEAGRVSQPALAARLGPRLEEGKLQKAAIVLFLLGGVSIIVKSVVFHT